MMMDTVTAEEEVIMMMMIITMASQVRDPRVGIMMVSQAREVDIMTTTMMGTVMDTVATKDTQALLTLATAAEDIMTMAIMMTTTTMASLARDRRVVGIMMASQERVPREDMDMMMDTAMVMVTAMDTEILATATQATEVGITMMDMMTITLTASLARDQRVVGIMMARVPRVGIMMDMMMDTVTMDTPAIAALVTVVVVDIMMTATIMASQAKDPMAARVPREDMTTTIIPKVPRVDTMMMDTVGIQKSMNMPHVMIIMDMVDGQR